ncbi:MAG TPA: GNAT family N-acetyltransferase [Myxococcota bacterium]|nr:GNAT family N-acetyltransferase [Myxococcota bacterium]
MADPIVRPARLDDVPLLACCVLAASRSHTARGAWDLALGDQTEAEKLRFLERLLTTTRSSWCHQSQFLVAELNGNLAAALSGFPAEDKQRLQPGEAMADAGRALGWSGEELRASQERLGPYFTCLIPDDPAAWIVEWVATLPQYRRLGLMDQLLGAILERGAIAGHRLAQITYFIGNEPARRAYEKRGFRIHGARRSPEFEAALSAPGLERSVHGL